MEGAPWPATEDELRAVQEELAGRMLGTAGRGWTPTPGFLAGGCFVAFARGEAGPGRPGDRAWAAAVVWPTGSAPVRRDGVPHRPTGQALRGSSRHDGPRQAADVVAQALAHGRVGAAYVPGLLALREGALLAAAVTGLHPAPAVLLVDATGLDHPRHAGLAIHLGAVTGLPTVGVTRRPLIAEGMPPTDPARGASAPLIVGDRTVAYWVRPRTGARPVVAHAAWKTTPETAVTVVLAASTEAARAPVPLQEARRAAREARDLNLHL